MIRPSCNSVITTPLVACLALITLVLVSYLSKLDYSVRNWALASRTHTATRIYSTITTLGNTLTLAVATVLICLALLAIKQWRMAILIGATMAVSSGVNMSLKALVGRERPPRAQLLGIPEHSMSFPSGHTLCSLVFAALLSFLIATFWPERWQSPLAKVALAVLYVLPWMAALVVAYSRIYLGYHWPTDLLGGWLVAALIIMLVQLLSPWAALVVNPFQKNSTT